MKRFISPRNIIRFIGILLALFLLTMAAWVVVAGPTTVFRILRYGDTNIDDFSHYPGRELAPSDTPFRFQQDEDELAVPGAVLAEFGGAGDLDKILEANDTIAFLVISGDTIRYERYYQGHTPSSLSQAFSMSKSFTSALIGMAIEDGLIAGVGQPITDFVPELAAHGFDAVTINNLLNMMSGTDYVENDNPFGEHVIFNFTPDLENEILQIRMERPPGELYRYKTGDNALLGLAMDRALGEETITGYTQRQLWTPLGMEDRGVWTIDHEGDGLEKTWCCLAASAHDFAKLGRLYLNGGAWDGEQLLSADWIAQSTQTGQVPEDRWPEDYKAIGWWNYGYQWWMGSKDAGDYFALGKDGQFLYVNPAEDVIIVRLGWSSGEMFSSAWIRLFQTIAREVR
jgi:CubicO group peptidase (beta-lactamase class C family)